METEQPAKTLTLQEFVKTTETPILSNLPAAFSYADLGIFCKLEYQIERKIPLMIRLGEVKYTERLEGKGQIFPE